MADKFRTWAAGQVQHEHCVNQVRVEGHEPARVVVDEVVAVHVRRAETQAVVLDLKREADSLAPPRDYHPKASQGEDARETGRDEGEHLRRLYAAVGARPGLRRRIRAPRVRALTGRAW